MQKYHFIKDEMLVHIPMCTHQMPQKILVIGGCENINKELSKYNLSLDIIHISDSNTVKELQELQESKFDVIVIASNMGSNREFWIEVSKHLESKGVIASVMSNLVLDNQNAKDELNQIGAIYRIVMPYRYESMIDGVMATEYMVLASRFYHPTADIHLQRADLTDGFEYYNSDIAISAFQMPTFINKEYLGIIKR